MSSPGKIAVYNLSDLKNTTDDALPNYLNSLKFRQLHYLTDVRLALGYAAVIIGGALFYFDWTLGWDATKAYTLPAVIAYFLLNGAFSYWLWFVEKGVIYVGEKQGTKLSISTRTEKHDPTYHLTATITSTASPSTPPRTLSLSVPFSRFYTSDGQFVAQPFQQWLASSVPVVGQADPNNVTEEIGRGNVTEANVGPSELKDVLNALKSGGGVKGGTRRRG
ncbi:hypothetical protein P152DRAFT_24646 [Eremomyces bilateralis CBS 781.70]|uniref:Signal peptidase complex subunit 2 n=1 Tax=Eremomyces bilateralis CBS 781.70 TaxID=1392243 RepID=A0A6G1GI26_9PEZI|nr:uncharacterized protein P152DRAFT_24646 [Eremomyces bilateralis CBS 781.70]KAF1817606.1 hypothetical protein P152DRAFT_24646 [Eremomyces bilateralis CBS 781.70]